MRKPTSTLAACQRPRRNQGGFILIYLLLLVALLSIGMLAALRNIEKENARDREEELIHRGTEYRRAVKRYYKKFGAFPPSIDALENTQNIRFLRKRYKDPMNRSTEGKEQDFKLLRMTDVRLSVGLPGAGVGANNGLGTANGLVGPNGPLGQTSQAVATALANQAVIAAGTNTTPLNTGNPPGDTSQGGDQNSGNPNGPVIANGPGQNANGSNSNSPFVNLNGQATGGTFGGAPIVGVASLNKKESIRVFWKKNHYNDWQFYYDPGSDRGGLLVGPTQSGAGLQAGFGTVTGPAQNGQGGPGVPSSPFSNGLGGNQPAQNQGGAASPQN
jgi:type II secretory pathway pseudopilin PulG